LLRATSISLSFAHPDGMVRVLRDVDLEVAQGELVALLGPSGSGKSSLLRIMAGLVEPDAGSCWREPGLITSRGIAMTMVPQRPTLVPWWTLEQNMLMPFRLAGRRVDAATLEHLDYLMHAVRLHGFRHSMPHELSGGMQARAALVRAFVTRPRLVLMDEPFSSLDELTRIDMCFELLRLAAETETGILFVTHAIQEAALLADRVVQLSARPGRVVRTSRSPLPKSRSRAILDSPELADFTRDLRRDLSLD
jgi:NitT/TauT family transport system ATP-binding protein